MAIEIKIVTAIFNPDSATANAYGLWQWDYGQVLRIQGLHLPSMVEIHFSLQETGGTSVNRVGVTKDGVTDVIIPDSMLENDGADRTYDMFAFIYLTDATSGQTEYKIKLQVKSRPKPEVPGGGENPNIFHEAVQAVQKSADKAAESEKQAEGWAHGREDLPERAQDNAKYYAGQAAADAKKTGTDRKEVERLVESVSGIDEQVVKVENLTKQAQTSATNAALSEQAAKTAETNAQTAQAGAETAEGNAELAERNAKASEQAVEKAKQLVTQMGQEVLDNKNHVDQTAQAFTLTAQQAVADVNNAGQTQTEQVLSVGESAVESVKTAQDTATQAVEIAKTEAVKSVQTEGTTQTGNVTAEGTKQVQAVQQAAQEIVADREQIQQNKADVTALKEDLDDLYGALTPFYTSVDLGSAIVGAVSKSDGSIIETGDVYHYRIPVTEGQKFVLSAWNAYSAYKAWLWLHKDGTVHSFYRNDSTYKQYTESVMAPCDGTLVIQQPYGHIPAAYILDGYRYSNLYQKKIYANGDSIMAGVGGVSFIVQIASKHNMTLDNVAVGGTTFVTSNSNSITSRVLSMSGEFDYIIIEGGYNDVFGNSPIGTLTTNYSDSFDSATVLGAVETICKHLRVNYSSSKILFVLGHRQSGIGLSNPRLDTMWDAIITALNKWSMPYVDIRKEGTLMAYNSEWLSSYFRVGETEGTHPNTLGYKLFYVPLVEAKLETL